MTCEQLVTLALVIIAALLVLFGVLACVALRFWLAWGDEMRPGDYSDVEWPPDFTKPGAGRE
uniref:Uncharacterized protein n=1 Tax=viral metagenome TaxID=1070528 RepID=A0A6M3KKI5_9ZZZZ